MAPLYFQDKLCVGRNYGGRSRELREGREYREGRGRVEGGEGRGGEGRGEKGESRERIERFKADM